MAENSKIAWTHATFNPWEGCAKISPACHSCYAAARDERWHQGKHWGQSAPRKTMSASYWRQPLKWDREAKAAGGRRRVFCSSLADVFEDHPTAYGERFKLWNLIAQTPNLDWLLLTKRPENIAKNLPWVTLGKPPWPNVWLGTTVENADYIWRIDELVKNAAVIHFLSIEPLLDVELGPLDLRSHLGYCFGCQTCQFQRDHLISKPKVDWVIVGGESAGPAERRLVRPCGGDGCAKGCRYCNGTGWEPTRDALHAVRSLRDQCVGAGVKFFLKQWGGAKPETGGRMLDGREWNEVPELTAATKPV